MKKNARRAVWPPCGPGRLLRYFALLVAMLALAGTSAVGAQAAAWQVGDVFTGVSNGDYEVWSNAGAFKEEINQGPSFGGQAQNASGFTTGCAFNTSLTHLYTTNFSTSNVVRFPDAHPHMVDQTIVTPAQVNGTFTGAGDALSESIVFAANGDFYVGHAGGTADLHKYNAAGMFIRDFNVATEVVGSDWIDLAADQATMFYTSEGRRVMRYDVVNDVQLPDFALVPGVAPVNNLFALRLLPPGDGSGGLLVADRADIKRLNGAGAVAQVYDVVGENSWFSLNLDPNGTSFWAGDFTTNNFYRFNIATGAVEVGPINTSASTGDTDGDALFGICVKGEPTAGGGGGCPEPTDGDDDGDGLKNSAETLLGLLSLDSDSDDDGTPDGDEDEDEDGEDNEDEDDDEDDDDCPDNEGDDDDDDDGVDNEDEDDD